MTLFRAYDIRGVYPSEIHEELAEAVGKGFGSWLSEGATVAVGGDVRTSTPALKAKLIEGLLSTGVNVIDVGMVATPLLYFYVASQQLAGGVVVTASHNPKQYNGIKLVGPGGMCLSWDTGISTIKDTIDTQNFRIADSGGLETRGIEEPYIRHVLSKMVVEGRKKVVVDAGNGACAPVAPKLFERLGWDVVPLFCEPDGTFPNHEADPIKKKNLEDLQAKVKETGADLGVAYDTDGDRLGVVNENGDVVENNTIFSLFIKDLLQKNPGKPIIYEVVVSKIIEDTIKKYGGEPVLMRVGHSYIQTALQEKKAILAGENSAHYFFPENYGYDDAMFASVKVAELLNKGSLSEREKEIPSYITSEEFRPLCADDKKFRTIEQLQKQLASTHNVNTIDGARVTLEKGWFIIRASNTGPQLVVRWEAEDQESFNEIGTLVENQLQSVGVEFHA